ncbi:MAG: response regulator [Burkholderiaceae bacterium]|nr:response regulator [Burkholderiaceae bacterium]
MTSAHATILIIDDEDLNRKLLEALLLSEGYRAICAASGEEALAMIAHQAPDLILLDIMMPGMDGYQVTSTLKANPATSQIPIILVSALEDRSARLLGLAAGAEEFLSKPIDRSELCLRVRNLLRLKEYSDFYQNHTRILEEQVQARTADLQRFRSALDATADAIFLTNRRTMQYVEVNATACTMLGYSREEFFKSGPASFNTLTRDALERTYDALIAGVGANRMIEALMRCKNGRALQVEVHRQVQRFGDDWIIVSVLRDITERKQAQQEILDLNASLEHRVRQRTAELEKANEELQSFSYSVSHDLRAPLRTIDGFNSLLRKEIDESAASARSKHCVTRISAGVLQMGELIDAMLSLAQVSRTSLRWDLVDMSALAQTILDGYQEQAPERELLCDIQPAIMARGDPALLKQVLDNLLGNAWKFTGQQPQTRIAFEGATRPDGETVYTVQDNGAGFDMADSNKLFSAFQRLHTASEFAGNGIGLATVHKIVTRHGGKIWAESSPGQGATFSFTLGQPPSSTTSLADPA